MSNAKHTIGPWIAAENEVLHTYKDGDTGCVAIAQWTGDQSEVNANASLIAAAPELLEALEAIVRSAELNQASINLPLLANASAAIAKARGE